MRIKKTAWTEARTEHMEEVERLQDKQKQLIQNLQG
jgi:hypothetical protein